MLVYEYETNILVYTSSITLLDFYNPGIRKKPMSLVILKPNSNSVTLKASHCTYNEIEFTYHYFNESMSLCFRSDLERF